MLTVGNAGNRSSLWAPGGAKLESPPAASGIQIRLPGRFFKPTGTGSYRPFSLIEFRACGFRAQPLRLRIFSILRIRRDPPACNHPGGPRRSGLISATNAATPWSFSRVSCLFVRFGEGRKVSSSARLVSSSLRIDSDQVFASVNGDPTCLRSSVCEFFKDSLPHCKEFVS